MVLILVGILSAFVLPRFFDRNVFDSRAFGDEAQSMVRYAQKLAVARNGKIYVCMTSTRVSLGVNDSCTQEVVMPSSKPATLSRSDLFISPVTTFYFDALGKPFSMGSSAFETTQFDLTIDGVTQSFFVEKETGYVH